MLKQVRFFNVVYDPNRNCMNISSNDLICFQIFTDEELIDPATDFGQNSNLPGQPRLFTADKNNLASINQVIKNYTSGEVYTDIKSYQSGFLDFLRYNNIYISSNIGGYQTLGPKRLQRTIVRKVPVTAGSGMVINDRVNGKHDILDCSKVTLSTLEFKFHDVYENVIYLNGCHVSFSLVFTTVVEDR